MKSITAALSLFIAGMFIVSCSSPKEELVTTDFSVKKEQKIPAADERVFKYEDRYYVKDAAIDKSTNIEDPLQAMRIIQLKPGSNETIVISSFDTTSQAGAQETWLGIEMPSFAPGTYDLAKAANIKFYQFYLGKTGKRFDGKTYEGSIKVEEFKGDAIIGWIEADISGVTRSFDEPSKEKKIHFSGSFRIKQVPLDATIIKAPNR